MQLQPHIITQMYKLLAYMKRYIYIYIYISNVELHAYVENLLLQMKDMALEQQEKWANCIQLFGLHGEICQLHPGILLKKREKKCIKTNIICCIYMNTMSLMIYHVYLSICEILKMHND